MKLKLKKAESLGAVHTHTHTRVNLKDKNSGITLVSLVVTIIILLILAGVTLALISGSDGILGRATHALDENKIAMAKEQVELALSDFQTEFYEGKYVERTNDGTKKEYISEKLQEGVETTNFYAQASAEGNVTVYEGKDTSGTQVVKGAIQDDASIKWDDVASGNGGSLEGGSGSGGTGGNINSEELEALNRKIEQFEEKISNLENQQKETNRALEASQNALEKLQNETIVNKRINLMNTPVEVPITTTPTERNIDIPLSDSIEKYKYLEIQFDTHSDWSSLGNHLESTSFIAIEQLKYNSNNAVNWENESTFTISSKHIKDASHADVVAWFKDSQTLHIGYSGTDRSNWNLLKIRKIYGIQ